MANGAGSTVTGGGVTWRGAGHCSWPYSMLIGGMS